jgi:hypothetical protein
VDGKEFHWCLKCNFGKCRWSPTHGTSNHVIGQVNNNNNVSDGQQQRTNAAINLHEGLYCQWTTDDDWSHEVNIGCVENFQSNVQLWYYVWWFLEFTFFASMDLPIYFLIFSQRIRDTWEYYTYILHEIVVCTYYLSRWYICALIWDLKAWLLCKRARFGKKVRKQILRVRTRLHSFPPIWMILTGCRGEFSFDDPSVYQSVKILDNTFDVLWDTGASLSVSLYKSDFLAPPVSLTGNDMMVLSLVIIRIQFIYVTILQTISLFSMVFYLLQRLMVACLLFLRVACV